MTTTDERAERFARLADPLPMHAVEGRQDGKVDTKDGRHSARFVLYTESWYLSQRLDTYFPGDWSLDVTPLPVVTDEDGSVFAVKGSLTVGGITREDIGQGKDWKQASTDSFKRAARRFGIGAELMLADALYVEVDSNSKYARPVESPAKAYFRRYRSLPRVPEYKHADDEQPVIEQRPVRSVAASHPDEAYGENSTNAQRTAAQAVRTEVPPANEPVCPKCSGRLWDNRKENDVRELKGEKLRPDWKCRDKECDGVIWREKESKLAASARANGVEAR
jgi:hypothetical protein